MDTGILSLILKGLVAPFVPSALSVFFRSTKEKLEVCREHLKVVGEDGEPKVRSMLLERVDELTLQRVYGIKESTEYFLRMQQVSKETGFPVSAIYKARLYYTLEDGKMNFENLKAPHVSKVFKALMVCASLFFTLKITSELMLQLPVDNIDLFAPVGVLFVVTVAYYFFWDWFTGQENIAIRLGEKQEEFRGSKGPCNAAGKDTPSRLALLREKVKRFLQKKTSRISKAQTSV